MRRRPAACSENDLVISVRRAVLVVATALVLGSCFTPSIPIPPPDPDQMLFAAELSTPGLATFRYAATDNYADAVVYIFNETEGRGIIDTARADGSVGPTEPFPAQLDDRIQVTFEADAQVVSTCVVYREGTPSSLCP